MKNIHTVILMALVTIVLLQGCSSSGPGAANADSINTTTKVLASNVIVDSRFLNISSTNVQSALETTNPSKINMIVGTWNTYSYSNIFQGDSGSMTIKSDGTFIINNGKNAFWPVASSGGFTYTDITNKAGKWSLLRGVLLQLSTDDQLGITNQVVYPLIFINNLNKFILVADVRTVIFEKLP